MPVSQRGQKHHRVAVIGLGRFGTAVARELYDLGYDVTAIDLGEKQVQDAAEYVTLAAQGDGTNRDLLLQLNVQESAAAIVAQGESLESSVLTTLLLKKLGIPWVVGKARSNLHGELLTKVGADRVVFPERDAGIRLAHSIGVRNVSDYLSLTATAGIAKLEAPVNLVGHPIGSALASSGDALAVLMIKRGDELLTVPGAHEVIRAGDELLICGADADFATFAERRPVGDPRPSNPG